MNIPDSQPEYEKLISKKLDLLSRFFDLSKILSLHPDEKYVQSYYKLNRRAYSLFHTRTGLIHMGISRDGIYKEDDLLEAVRIVGKYISNFNASNVLELGTGRGANSYWLATRFPSVNFGGIDTSDVQLRYAFNRAKRIKNYFPEKGDFHDLSRYSDSSVDIVFEIEAFCYSMDESKVFKEVQRILRPGGLFIMLNGYRGGQTLSPQIETACSLVEKGMAIERLDSYPELIHVAQREGFSLKYEEDASEFIQPCLSRFEKLARRFFSHYWLSILPIRLAPQVVTYNLISGFLMLEAFDSGALRYMITVLEKKS